MRNPTINAMEQHQTLSVTGNIGTATPISSQVYTANRSAAPVQSAVSQPMLSSSSQDAGLPRAFPLFIEVIDNPTAIGAQTSTSLPVATLAEDSVVVGAQTNTPLQVATLAEHAVVDDAQTNTLLPEATLTYPLVVAARAIPPSRSYTNGIRDSSFNTILIIVLIVFGVGATCTLLFANNDSTTSPTSTPTGAPTLHPTQDPTKLSDFVQTQLPKIAQTIWRAKFGNNTNSTGMNAAITASK